MSPQPASATQTAGRTVPVKQSTAGDVFDRIRRTNDSIARRAFEISDNNGRVGHELEDWLCAESEILHPIHLEMAEFDGALTVRAEVPGFSASEIEINVEPRKLIIAGKHDSHEERKKGRTIYSEQCAKEILRIVDLPTEIENAKAHATLEGGVLEIDLPKASRA